MKLVIDVRKKLSKREETEIVIAISELLEKKGVDDFAISDRKETAVRQK